MGMNWTEEQQKVIDLRDCSMLVSAAAGSGKTAVLVERIIKKIIDPITPVDIDRLLVVTFTNAAAAEMRERVSNAIEAALEADPANRHLQKQLTLVHNARITTIDSFCMDVIRNHFHRIDLEPGFRIGDEGELKLLREEVCDATLEDFYASEDPEFLAFSDNYSSAKSDEKIKEMILQLYDYSVSYPWPEEWLEECAGQYQAGSVEELEEKPWVKDLLAYLKVRSRDLLEHHRSLLELTQCMDGPYMYEGSIRDDLRQLEELTTCEHLQEWYDALHHMKFKMIGNARKYEGSEEKKQAVAAGRDRMKKQITELQKSFFTDDMEQQLELLKKTGEMVAILVRLTSEFSRRFRAKKADKNIIDFSDGEHFALRALIDPETKELTEIAREYQQQFTEIMIDEYQDSNYVQESLLTAVSGISAGRENLFMVGDVKQSIYRFRLARPELFMEKYNSYSKDGGKRQRIDLYRNFRSRPEVVNLVNDVFYHVMGADLGNVEYDAEAALYAGASFPEVVQEGSYDPELILVPEADGENRQMAEARVVAQRIRQMMEKQELPDLHYRDIVLLLRSMSGWTENFQKVFAEEGIPLVVASQTGYFSAPEVETVLQMLRVIDNPRQDIPLTAVMTSWIGGFCAEELAWIRAEAPDQPFYANVLFGTVPENLLKNPQKDELNRKLEDFRSLLKDFRNRVSYTPIHQLLIELLEETGYLDYVTALPAGQQRRANLDMLIEKAIAYEKTSYHGVFHFVRYIDQLMKYDVDYGEAEIISEQEDAVRLMSIHKSKGLEFPVVFVCGMGKQFNMQDARSTMIFHPEYGIGLKWFDHERRTKSDTLIRQIFAMETKKENLGEELRVLYVALTRAKEKLLLVGGSKNVREEEDEAPLLEKEEKLSFSKRFDAVCYWNWVLPALRGTGKPYQIYSWDQGKELEAGLERELSTQMQRQQLLQELEDVDEEIYERINRRLTWQYPYADAAIPRQKVSVSELKHRAVEEAERAFSEQETDPIAETFVASLPAEPNSCMPRFMQEEEEEIVPGASGALRGTAVHRFLECLDFAALPEFQDWKEAKNALQEVADRLAANGRMDRISVSRMNFYEIYQFLQTETAKEMRIAAGKGLLRREQPFVMELPADTVWEEVSKDSTVLVQGIMDAFWENEDGIVLLDYKTDRVKDAKELIDRYEKQLRLYADALARSFPEKQITHIWIYSFYLNQEIEII